MRRKNCKKCGNDLQDTKKYTGLCVGCAESTRKSIVRTLIVCTIVGSVFAAIFFGIVYFTQLNDDGTYYGTEIGFKIYLFFALMNRSTFGIIIAVLFFLPFGIGLDASYLPNVNTGYYEGNAFLSLLKWFICTLLAPIFIVYLIIYTKKLKRYIAQ